MERLVAEGEVSEGRLRGEVCTTPFTSEFVRSLVAGDTCRRELSWWKPVPSSLRSVIGGGTVVIPGYLVYCWRYVVFRRDDFGLLEEFWRRNTAVLVIVQSVRLGD